MGQKLSATKQKLNGLLILAAVSWGGTGCSVPSYDPPALPAFLHEDVAVQVAPPAPLTLSAAEESPVHACAGTNGAQPSAANQLPSTITLPEAVHECIFANLVIQAGAEKVQQARAGLLQASLIPNPMLYLDSILNPLPGEHFTPTKQGGPPQDDVAVSFPIDWYVFGKRLATMEAGRLGVDVAAADLANLVRLQVTNTVIAFYDALEARDLLKIGQLDLADARRIETTTEHLIKSGELPPIERDRAHLQVLDASRELRRREAAYNVARAKLAPLLGRGAPLPELDVRGDLAIAYPAPPLEVPAAMQLAEQQRPDLIALRRRIDQAEAEIVKEKRKAFPLVNVQPWFTYQFQTQAIGYPDARSWGMAMTTSLPFTNRNQGNIARAMSMQREAVHRLHGELAAVRSEVTQAVHMYEATMEVARNVDPAAVAAARRLRDKTELAFRKGQEPLLTLLLVQRAYLDRLRLSITVRADYWRALQRLNAAVGGRATGCVPRREPEVEELPRPRLEPPRANP